DAWGRKSSKYHSGRTAQKWRTYTRSPPDRIGAGSIIHWANEAAPGWWEAYAAKQVPNAAKLVEQLLKSYAAKRAESKTTIVQVATWVRDLLEGSSCDPLIEDG